MEKIILVLAIGLGVFFRVWQLGSIPNGLAMDEAAFGYNAWSIAQTGRDEYGKLLPLSFRSFADFKLPAYGYLSAVVVGIFGPGVWQTRTVSTIAGLVSCYFLYLIVKGLTGDRKLSALSGLLMLWSPWGVLFSRGAFEGNLGLTFMLVAIWALVKARKDARFLILAVIGLSAANYSYITYKFVGPLLLIFWTIAYRKTHKFGKAVVIPWLLFALLNLPAYLSLTGISGNNRVSSLLKLDPEQTGYPAIIQLVSSYSTYFSPRNLFIRPDPVRHRHFLDLSVFYAFFFPLWVVGIYEWYKNRKTELAKWVVVLLLLGAIPAAISQDPFATLRAIPMLPAYCVLLAMGGLRLSKWVKRGWLLLISVVLIGLMTLQLYSALMVAKHGQVAEWNGGIEELSRQLEKYPNRPVFVDIPHDVYPNLALALKFQPQEMQYARADLNPSRYYSDPVFPETIKFGRYAVGKTDRSSAAEIPGAILVVRPENISTREPRERDWRGELFRIVDSQGNILYLAYELN